MLVKLYIYCENILCPEYAFNAEGKTLPPSLNHGSKDIQNASILWNKLIFGFVFIRKTNSIGSCYISVNNNNNKIQQLA